MCVRANNVACAAVLLAAVGCSDGSQAPNEQLGVGTIEPPLRIEVPTTAAVGETITVKIFTLGGGCVKQGPTQVAVNGLVALVTPMDIFTIEAAVPCQEIGRSYKHVGELRFLKAGDATVRIQGFSGTENEIITVERSVTVR